MFSSDAEFDYNESKSLDDMWSNRGGYNKKPSAFANGFFREDYARGLELVVNTHVVHSCL